MWNEKGRGMRGRSAGQPKRTTDRQEWRLGQLGLQERFATIRKIGDQFLEEEEEEEDRLISTINVSFYCKSPSSAS